MNISFITSLVAGERHWHETEPWVRLGNRTVVWLLGGLLAFSALVSISGAVVATGLVTVESNYKTVQHLDGGIVAKIHVRNGQEVAQGDLLLKLDDTQAQASLGVVKSRVQDLLVQEARLSAERDGSERFAVPGGIDAGAPAVEKVMAAQEALFRTRRTAQAGQVAVLAERVTQIAGELRANEAELSSAKRQKEINARELKSVLPLFERGYVNQQRISPLERESARLEGEIERLGAQRAKLKSAEAEIGLRVAQAEKDYMNEVVDELRKVQAELAEEQERMKAAADKLERTDVRAPRAGRINRLAVHTEGGVVTAATPILDIVPQGETLVVEARVLPQDIDKVRTGQSAALRFPAFNAHTTPRLEGRVNRVSPAELRGENGASYFTAEVTVSPEELAKLGPGHALVPGMPAEVMIETTSRSILSYFVKPLEDMLARTFRET